MAGVGVRLNKIFGKNTIATDILGFGYSTVITVAPMFVIIGNILLMGKLLGLSKLEYSTRELFSSTVLYIFIFGLLTTAPFNAVISKYMSDVIYEERYEDIRSCFWAGLFTNMLVSLCLGIPFVIHEYFTGGVDILYIFIGYCGYIGMVLVFYTMTFLSICKEYGRIARFYFFGQVLALVLALMLVYWFNWEITWAMLFSLTVGFMFTACLQLAQIKQYFVDNSNVYKPFFVYFREFAVIAISNLLYTAGLYVHNFVFWNTDMRIVVAKSFVSAPTYDLATCIAMFTNISATIILTVRMEMFFHERYKSYSEAVIGGKGTDIDNSKRRMFRQLASEIMTLVRIQFIVSVVVFLAAIVILPQFGISGLVMQIYPSLAVGYFILFVMYSALIFLYYFKDNLGALLTTGVFFIVTLVGSYFSTKFPVMWYGAGVIMGAFAGWTVAYLRLRFIERNLDKHIFCAGEILGKKKGRRPDDKVYSKSWVKPAGEEFPEPQKAANT